MSDKPQRSSGGAQKIYVKGYSEAGASAVKRALKAFLPNSGSPIDDIDENNFTLRQRSRLLYMASPVATSAIDTNRTKVVGCGLTMQSCIDRDVLGLAPDAAKIWQRKTESEFRLWASKPQNCDALGINDFNNLQQLALKSWLMSGDIFALVKRYEPTPLNPYSLRFHLVEADRISTPSKYWADVRMPRHTEGKNADTGNLIHDGVEVDANGLVVAYHISNKYPYESSVATMEWQRVEAYGKKTGLPNVLQIMDTERPDQYRGVPYLSKVIEPLLQLRRYTESELMAALVQSFFSAWVKTEENPSDMPLNEVGTGDLGGVPSTNPVENDISKSENEYEMGPGTVSALKPGEDIVFGNPNIPTAGFDTFVKALCRMVGAALEIPYDVLLKEFDASYSASRGALLEAWEAVKMRRSWLVNRFCQPAYELWLTEAVARGRIKAPGFFDDPLVRAAWCGAQWIGPVQGSLDPKKEVQAAILQINHGLTTHQQVTRETGGGDWEDNVAQLAHENELLQAAGGTPMVDPEDNDSDDDEGGEDDADT